MNKSHLTAVLKDMSVLYGEIVERTTDIFTVVNDISGTSESINVEEVLVATIDTMDEEGEFVSLEKLVNEA